MMPSPGNKGARKRDTNRVQEGPTPVGNQKAGKSPQHPMSSPGNKDDKKEDTNRVQEGHTQVGNSKADKSPHHSNRLVKQTTVRCNARRNMKLSQAKICTASPYWDMPTP